MEKLNEQEIKGFNKDKDVFYYKRYADSIKISNYSIDVDASVFVVIYKNGTFDIKTKKGNSLVINEKNISLDKKYSYDLIKKFLESNRSDKSKFSYLFKMIYDLIDIGNTTHLERLM